MDEHGVVRFSAVHGNQLDARSADFQLGGAIDGCVRFEIPHIVEVKMLAEEVFFFNDLAFLGLPRKSLKFLTLLFSIPAAQPAFLFTHCAASTVSLKPIALVTAISVERRGLPCTDNAR